MDDLAKSRRNFLKGTLLGGAIAGTGLPVATLAEDSQSTVISAVQPLSNTAKPQAIAYNFLTPKEASFVEALVDHMVPADELCPKGSDLGVNIYIDRALSGNWGRGDRLFLQGPWKRGTPSQGYQLPLTPAQLYRAGMMGLDHYLNKTYGKSFEALTSGQKDEVLQGMESGRIAFVNGIPPQTFFSILYQTVMEGLFSDPIYGGNADKAAWKMIGFPGAIATHGKNIVAYKNKKFQGPILSIADAS
jgi:gluconate 2-dehydrogenase gamma chain